MKKSSRKVLLALAIPLSLLFATSIANANVLTVDKSIGIYQAADLDARLAAIEKRIYALKQLIADKPQFKQHRGALSSIENKKNSLKAKLKSKDRNNSQIEQDLNDLESKVAALESAVK